MKKNGTRGEIRQREIYDTAVAMFAERGYHAVTLRKLAESVGMQAGSLYNHIENKQELLFNVLHGIMLDLVRSYEEKSEGITHPAQLLDVFVENHVIFHTSRQMEVFIGNMELRNLEPDNFKTMVGLRDKYQNYLVNIVSRGNQEGAFRVAKVRMTVFAILGMLNSVSIWFRTGGALQPEEVAAHYREMVWAIVTPDRPTGS